MEAAHEFRFVEDPYSYWLGPERLPNVTGVIRDNGLLDTRFYTEESRARGRAVHQGLALYAVGRLVWDERAERMRGYLESARKLWAFFKPRVLGVEMARYHPLWRYAGRLDAHWLVDRDEVIVDYKTGHVEPWTGYQLWANDLMMPERRARKHWGVQVFEDGSLAKVTEFDSDPYLGDKFLTLLGSTRERIAHGRSTVFAAPSKEEGVTA